MDSMPKNNSIGTSKGGKSIFQAAFKLYSVVFKGCAKQQKCVYCKKKIYNLHSVDALLSSEEAERVPKMCPHHFNIGNRNIKYFKEPQDPQKICKVCTVIFRSFLKTCNFTSSTTITFDTLNLKCLSSMVAAGRNFNLDLVNPAVPNKSQMRLTTYPDWEFEAYHL